MWCRRMAWGKKEPFMNNLTKWRQSLNFLVKNCSQHSETEWSLKSFMPVWNGMSCDITNYHVTKSSKPFVSSLTVNYLFLFTWHCMWMPLFMHMRSIPLFIFHQKSNCIWKRLCWIQLYPSLKCLLFKHILSWFCCKYGNRFRSLLLLLLLLLFVCFSSLK